MASGARKYVPGFRLLNQERKKRDYLVGIAVSVDRGDAVIITAGYLALATTFQLATAVFVGIANSVNTAAEAVASGTITCEVIPPLFEYDWMCPLEATNALVQATDVGLVVDLQSEDGLDNTDAVTLGVGFQIDAVDVSTAALAASANLGFATGHFVFLAAS